MKSSEEFKQALRAGKLNEAFLVAMSNAPELHITTWVTSASDTHDWESHSQPEAGKCLRTHINLIEGKIENEIGEQFVGDRYPEIQQFHRQQVSQGHQTIQQNLESLQKMFNLMSAFQKQQQQADSLSWIDVNTTPTNLEQERAIGSLGASKTVKETEAVESSDFEATAVEPAHLNSPVETETKPEPQLPAFNRDADEEVVNDLLSIVDSDKNSEDNEDWGDWLEEDETPMNQKVDGRNSSEPNRGAEEWDDWEEDSPPPTNEQPKQ